MTDSPTGPKISRTAVAEEIRRQLDPKLDPQAQDNNYPSWLGSYGYGGRPPWAQTDMQQMAMLRQMMMNAYRSRPPEDKIDNTGREG